MAFGQDGTLMSISWDHTIRLWDLASRQQRLTIDTDLEDVPGSAERMAGQPIAELAGHTGYVNAVTVSPDGTLIAAAGADKTVQLWEARS